MKKSKPSKPTSKITPPHLVASNSTGIVPSTPGSDQASPGRASTSVVAVNNLSRDSEARKMLTPSIGRSLEEVFSPEWDTIGFEITEPVPIEHLHESRIAILSICKPAPDEMIIAGLAKLRALTSSRARDDRSTDIQIEAYIEELKAWPADAVVQALNDAPSRSKWFPTWYELEEQLKYLTTDRRLIVAAIDRRIARLEKTTSVQGLIKGALK